MSCMKIAPAEHSSTQAQQPVQSSRSITATAIARLLLSRVFDSLANELVRRAAASNDEPGCHDGTVPTPLPRPRPPLPRPPPPHLPRPNPRPIFNVLHPPRLSGAPFSSHQASRRGPDQASRRPTRQRSVTSRSSKAASPGARFRGSSPRARSEHSRGVRRAASARRAPVPSSQAGAARGQVPASRYGRAPTRGGLSRGTNAGGASLSHARRDQGPAPLRAPMKVRPRLHLRTSPCLVPSSVPAPRGPFDLHLASANSFLLPGALVALGENLGAAPCPARPASRPGPSLRASAGAEGAALPRPANRRRFGLSHDTGQERAGSRHAVFFGAPGTRSLEHAAVTALQQDPGAASQVRRRDSARGRRHPAEPPAPQPEAADDGPVAGERRGGRASHLLARRARRGAHQGFGVAS